MPRVLGQRKKRDKEREQQSTAPRPSAPPPPRVESSAAQPNVQQGPWTKPPQPKAQPQYSTLQGKAQPGGPWGGGQPMGGGYSQGNQQGGRMPPPSGNPQAAQPGSYQNYSGPPPVIQSDGQGGFYNSTPYQKSGNNNGGFNPQDGTVGLNRIENTDSDFYNPGRLSVGPSGSNLLSALVGGQGGAGNYLDFSGMGTLLNDGGTGDPFHQARQQLNWMMSQEGNGGVVGSTGAHLQSLADSAGRYGAARQDVSFDDWFGVGSGAGGPMQGVTNSMIGRALGAQGGQGFGYRGADGNPTNILESDPMKGYQSGRAQQLQNPDLGMDAYSQAGQRGIDAMRGGGLAHPGVADVAGRLSSDTSMLNNRYESDLMDAIRTESQIGLEGQLDGVASRMGAAGLGRSGANQRATTEAWRGATDQANRDMIRSLSGFAETGRGIDANALMTGAQGEMGAHMQDAGQMGQSIMGAMGLEGQGLGAAQQRYQGDQSNLAQMLLGTGGLQQQSLANESQQQLAGFGQYMDMYNQRQGDYASRQQNMLGLSEQDRLLKQQAVNQRISTSLMPIDLMTTLSSGTTAPSFRPQAQSNPWEQLGIGALGNLGGQYLGGAMNQGSFIPDFSQQPARTF